MWNRDERGGEGARRENMPRPGDELRRASGDEPRRASACSIGKSVVIRGEVISSEDLIIDGCVEGTIELSGHCLTVGAGASIKAELVGRIITVGGTVTGNIAASEEVAIRATGSVEGDIRAPRIAVSDGAVLCGRVETERRDVAAAELEQSQFPVAV
jgi:cytoskeletal protein CcmA (bactofilin family)